MGWTPETQAFFIGLNLGPTLHQNGFDNVKIMIMDDQRILIPKWPETVRLHLKIKTISVTNLIRCDMQLDNI